MDIGYNRPKTKDINVGSVFSGDFQIMGYMYN
jgi:hypothetical protein